MAKLSSDLYHGTTIAIGDAGVLIAGPSGAGKSDLALRLIDRGAILVSDDQTLLKRSGSKLIATSPGSIRGKMEIRGVGIIDMPSINDVTLRLVVRLSDSYERLPMSRQVETLAGIEIDHVRLKAFEISAPLKVEHALRAVLSKPLLAPSYKAPVSL